MVSIRASALLTPCFESEPASAMANNWPLVGPQTPLISGTPVN
jgi:hypothetical protein